MLKAERESILEALDENSLSLLALVGGLSEEQIHHHPSPDQWNIGQVLEHVVAAEKVSLHVLIRKAAGPPEPEKRSSLTMTEDEFIRMVSGRVGKIRSPRGAPTGELAPRDAEAAFRAARHNTRTFAADTTADLRRYFLAHPMFGELDGVQWLRLIAAHSQRHSLQIEEIKSSPGFPA